MKNSNDTIGNRARDLPASSAVPQPTAPPCTSTRSQYESVISVRVRKRLLRDEAIKRMINRKHSRYEVVGITQTI